MTIRKPDFLWLAAGATALAMTPVFAETPTYKMTTDIPANVLTPDKM
ncbi:hypothetical protein [Pseudophaeobacter leonis]|nr:hypothetical protein [Pseudophaeobacter leonis]